jgi:hypothetical protein
MVYNSCHINLYKRRQRRMREKGCLQKRQRTKEELVGKREEYGRKKERRGK